MNLLRNQGRRGGQAKPKHFLLLLQYLPWPAAGWQWRTPERWPPLPAGQPGKAEWQGMKPLLSFTPWTTQEKSWAPQSWKAQPAAGEDALGGSDPSPGHGSWLPVAGELCHQDHSSELPETSLCSAKPKAECLEHQEPKSWRFVLCFPLGTGQSDLQREGWQWWGQGEHSLCSWGSIPGSLGCMQLLCAPQGSGRQIALVLTG